MQNELTFEVAARDGTASRLVIVRAGGVEVHRDKLDTDKSKAREDFARAVARRMQIEPDVLIQRCDAELPRLADQADQAAEQQAAEQGSSELSASIAPPWPEPWPEPVALAEAVDETLESIHRHVVLSKEAGIATALWVAWSYAVDRGPTGPAGDIAPLLTIVSPVKRCGKTSLLSVLTHLCPRVVPASNIRPAALFRTIETERPTLLIDEAETFLREDDELRGIVNAGHRRDLAYVVRCVEADRDFIPRKFSVWCPKVLAQIGAPAATIEDRSVIIRLQRKRRDEVVERLNAAAAERLRETARRLMAAVTQEVRAGMYAAEPEIPLVLNDRQADNWRSLLALADLAGGYWPAAARNAAIALSVAEDADAESIGILAIADALVAFGDDDRLSPSELADRMAAMADRPWPKFSRGAPITPRKLANLLAPYALTARRTKAGRFYHRGDFEGAFSRYSDTPPETKRHCVTPEPNPLWDNDLRGDATKKQSATENHCVTPQVQDWQGLTATGDAVTQENTGWEKFEL